MNQNPNNFPFPLAAEANILTRQVEMSEAFYQRNCVDPLQVAHPTLEFRQQIIEYADAQIPQARLHGKVAEALDFTLDGLYRSLPLETANESIVRIHAARDLIERRLSLGDRISASERLGLQMQQLDLMGLQAFRSYHATSKSGDPAARRSALQILDATSAKQIQIGAKILGEAQKVHEGMPDGDASKELRGKMFELLFVTDQRRRQFSAEEYDQSVLVSATRFEDKPSITFTPNHNYDVISFDASGKTFDVFQCKNASSKMQYEQHIKMVEGRTFIEFIKNPEKYINAMRILSTNSPAIPEQVMTGNRKLLEGLFDEKQLVAGHVGGTALR
jgi:hypothetical protein